MFKEHNTESNKEEDEEESQIMKRATNIDLSCDSQDSQNKQRARGQGEKGRAQHTEERWNKRRALIDEPRNKQTER